jgi:putative spermidine/putrescine transport system permease protein
LTDAQPRPRLPAGGGAGLSGAARPTLSAGRVAPRLLGYLGLLPFVLFVALFLFWPTVVVVVGAFQDADGHATLQNLAAAVRDANLSSFVWSIVLSATTALLGAVIGGLLAWAVATGRPDSLLRRAVLAASGTLAQFGGVMLAFAFLATFGFNGLVTLFLKNWLGVDLFAWGAWLYELPGLALVYTYFQIPLMVIVFLPAVEGLRPQWREACQTLGGDSRAYWWHVGLPILWPSFLGACLLLFANAFSAYATAAALISQASPLVTLRIGTFLTSEVALGQENLGKALAFGMIVIVVATTALYALLQARSARWLR